MAYFLVLGRVKSKRHTFSFGIFLAKHNNQRLTSRLVDGSITWGETVKRVTLARCVTRNELISCYNPLTVGNYTNMFIFMKGT